MKVAIISDVHSNVEALTAVLEYIQGLGVHRIYSLGDIVGYGPDPVDIISMMRDNVYAGIMGNHDEAVLTEPRYFNRIPYEAVMWTKIQLSYQQEDCLAYLQALPEILHDEGMVFTHGLLDNNMCYVDSTDDLMVIFEGMGQDDFICFGGHSHYPSVWVLEDGELHSIDIEPGEELTYSPLVEKSWVNVGSVGQPRDGDSRASFMTWDTEEKRIGYHRVPYDFRKTMQKIRHIPELDNFLADRLEKGT